MNAICYILIVTGIVFVVTADENQLMDYDNLLFGKYDVSRLFQEDKSIGRRANENVGTLKPNTSLLDMLQIITRSIRMALEITTAQTVKGTKNITNNLQNYGNDGTRKPASTAIGEVVGKSLSIYLKDVLKDRWVALVTFIMQEILDRTVEGIQEFLSRLTAACMEWYWQEGVSPYAKPSENPYQHRRLFHGSSNALETDGDYTQDNLEPLLPESRIYKGSRGNVQLNKMYAKTEADDYTDVTVAPPPVVTETDNSEDFDRFEIHEFEDPVTKNYHCSMKDRHQNETIVPSADMINYFDSNGIPSIRPKKNYYQVRDVRRKLCQFGFNPFEPDNKVGSIHKRFKNTLRLMLYNTPGMFPGLKVIRNDLDRKRKREPQIWFRFEATNGTLLAEFDYDNYFVTVSGDLARVQAYSKLLVALKMHKRLNNFNEPVSSKVNLDLGIMEAILTSFGIWMMKEKAVSTFMVNALNGIRTEIGDKGETRLEFDETLKDAADQVDPVLYSYVWLLSMAEKYDVVKIRERNLNGQGKPRNSSNDNVARMKRDHAADGILKT